MSKIALIYPGQGAQKAGMGADFYERSETARSLFDQAGDALGLDMSAFCFEENERLDLTEYTQAALVTTCLAITRVIEKRGLKPDITAGLSLGEYSAIAAAGGMEDLDAIRLVRKRGILMQNTVPAGEGGMCAVMGLNAAKIEEILESLVSGEQVLDDTAVPVIKKVDIKKEDVSIANYNCPGQIVITGRLAAVEAASVRLKEAGAKRVIMLNVSGPFHSPMLTASVRLKEAGAKRVIMLNVSGPFHSPMLTQAGEELAKELDRVRLHPLQVPYVTNVTAEKVEGIDRTKELLKRQVSSPVRWMQSMEYMIGAGIDRFVEIGPGRTLAGFMKKINRDVKVYNIASWDDMEKVTEHLG